MRPLLAFLFLASLLTAEDWQRALPGKEYHFPADHFAHPDFKTEWWYVTGNLDAADGRRFGFQFTIFRQGIRPPGQRGETTSRFVVDHLHFGHFAISDPSDKAFHFEQKAARGSFGEAGSSTEAATSGKLAWVEDWEIALTDDGGFALAASTGESALQIDLNPTKKPVFHGEGGASQKAAGEGNASHYYSFTNLETTGTLVLDGKEIPVTGLSWLDREWSTSVLGEGQIGWDWFALHLDDGSELMIYQMRREDGQRDPYSSGSHIAVDGGHRKLRSEDFTLTPQREWTSPNTGGIYPVKWRVEVPSLGVDATVTAVQDRQELALQPVSYWEGMVDMEGSHTGRGYLEMTGYAGPVAGLKD